MPFHCARFIIHRVAIKTGFFQYFAALFSLAVQITWRAFGQTDIQVAVRFNRVIDNFSAGILLRPSPDGETKPPTRFQNAACFRTRLVRM